MVKKKKGVSIDSIALVLEVMLLGILVSIVYLILKGELYGR